MSRTRESTSQSQTVTITEERPRTQTQSEPQQLVLRLNSRPPPTERRVTFTPDTIDNEHMGRLKSNCCCIYVPERKWDDPSTWEPDEAETEHCRGHTLPPPPPPKKPQDDKDKKPDCCDH
uniref:Protein phosphatase 1 regulatory subunit 11 n=1 Tax=Panagrolaimus sp. JU765 TaxID=591449 RepID=A0AC34RQZ8_9BILA